MADSNAEGVFIGVDLAWRSERNPTGVAVLRGGRAGARLEQSMTGVRGVGAVDEIVREHEGPTTVIAIDAPLIVRNRSGQRLCERLVGVRYGSRGASCHSTNLALYPRLAGVVLSELLERRGYKHPHDTFMGEAEGRVMLEVYPHAALVALFNLPRIVRYKKGRIGERRLALQELRELLQTRLAISELLLVPTPPWNEVLSTELAALRGAAYKQYEDRIDALFCAYLAFFFWRWGFQGSELLGTLDDGYIANPRLGAAKAVPVVNDSPLAGARRRETPLG